ncbi:MAG: SDR family NAD(P)-dependent oxidoreductase [Deltaproteobacteria bacterium]|nr:MAG: SDR family NAD(P)-dependent oxidoreductase [Deltaproteobacteria bacterium]TMQ03596.1 MAG: SDR family NAD(P)-dependent oxidoreductase [Deltaproteobacteria bacterium]
MRDLRQTPDRDPIVRRVFLRGICQYLARDFHRRTEQIAREGRADRGMSLPGSHRGGMKLAGKTVVVTGAGSGIGRATALAFAREGARICACDVAQPRLDALAAELADRALVVRRVDVADRAQMRGFAEAVHAAAPAADIVVNNAGVAVGGSFLDTSLDDWDWLLGINLRGVIHGCHFFVPKMVERRTGHVFNISSILGIFPAPNVTAYVASKFAVLGFSQSLRAELAPDVHVTAICPGMIDTAIIADGRLAGDLVQRKSKMTERFKKGIPPSRVADAILEALRTNPAVRTVGRDAWAIHKLTKLAPQTLQRVGSALQRRFGAAE